VTVPSSSKVASDQSVAYQPVKVNAPVGGIASMWPAPFRLIRLVAYSVFLIACTTYSSDLLPHGWSTHYSNGVAYYYNQKTGVTQWEKPVVSSQSRPLPQQTRPLQAQNMRPAQSVSSNPHQQHKLHHTAQQNRQEDAITSRTSHGPNVPNDFTKDIVSSPSLRSRNDSTSARGGNLTRPESTAVLSDVQQFISKLRDADKKIDDLNLVIDDLEEEKAQLLLRKQLNDDAMANLTSAADVLKLAALEEYSVIHSALLAQITTLESSVDKRSQEMENLRSSNSDLERNIVSVRETINVTTSTISEFLSNITTGESRLKSNRDKLTQQDRELADEYKNIGQLEEDMRNVAGPSLKRLRQPSFFGRVLESAFPVWAGGKGSLKSSRRAKGREAAALAAVEAAKELNATVEHIRNNLTVMAATIASREVAIEELSEQLEERIDEASKRCVHSILIVSIFLLITIFLTTIL
jgi:predicted  nucleic acid-binding Zn-ribbon protein